MFQYRSLALLLITEYSTFHLKHIITGICCKLSLEIFIWLSQIHVIEFVVSLRPQSTLFYYLGLSASKITGDSSLVRRVTGPKGHISVMIA